MDRQRIIEKLGLVSDGAFRVMDMHMVDWGRHIIFACEYQTVTLDGIPDDPIMFNMVLRDCREIKYRVYAHIAAHEQGIVTKSADMAELNFGKGNHRKDMHMLTNHFSISVSYGEFVIERGELSFDFN